MAQVAVTINGRTYRMACDDGEEERLIGLGKRFDSCINQLRSSFGEIGDQRLTVMAGVMVIDQLSELERKAQALSAELAALKAENARLAASESALEADIAARLDAAAERISALTDTLERGNRDT